MWISKEVDDIIFLWDADWSKSYRDLIDMENYTKEAWIGFKKIKWNHDQAWLDYWKWRDKEFVIAKDIVDNWMDDKQILKFISKMTISINDVKRIFYFIGLYKYKIQFRHALPKWKKESWRMRSKKLKNDHRFNYPDLWYSSFWTNNAIWNWIESYDPEILLKTFSYMNSRLIDYIIKWHEHTNKIWTKEWNNIKWWELIRVNSWIIYPKRESIIQLWAFENWNYAILYKKIFKIWIEFLKLK